MYVYVHMIIMPINHQNAVRVSFYLVDFFVITRTVIYFSNLTLLFLCRHVPHFFR